MNSTPDDRRDAVAGPVDWPVRPCAWIAPTPLDRLRSGSLRVRVTTELRKAPENYDVPLYDRAELDAAVAAERERCAKLCEEEAERWRGEQDITDFRLCAARIRSEV